MSQFRAFYGIYIVIFSYTSQILEFCGIYTVLLLHVEVFTETLVLSQLLSAEFIFYSNTPLLNLLHHIEIIFLKPISPIISKPIKSRHLKTAAKPPSPMRVTEDPDHVRR